MNITNSTTHITHKETSKILFHTPSQIKPSNSAGIKNPTELSDSLKDTLKLSDDSSQINEEQLQHGLVQHLLNELHPKAADAYKNSFESAQKEGKSVEESVKEGLKGAVNSGEISEERAEQINGLSFRAAQLDENLDALYDSKGSENDPTVATASLSEAVEKITETLTSIQNDTVTPQPRELDAPSNTVSGSSISNQETPRTGDFLWKPQSERNGNLVVLLPAQYSGEVVDAGIYSSQKATDSTLIERGDFSGDNHNGGRAHFRFNKPGQEYPNEVYVVAKMSNGKTVSFSISDSSSRNNY